MVQANSGGSESVLITEDYMRANRLDVVLGEPVVQLLQIFNRMKLAASLTVFNDLGGPAGADGWQNFQLPLRGAVKIYFMLDMLQRKNRTLPTISEYLKANRADAQKQAGKNDNILIPPRACRSGHREPRILANPATD